MAGWKNPDEVWSSIDNGRLTKNITPKKARKGLLGLIKKGLGR
jgi:hypothetical protein